MNKAIVIVDRDDRLTFGSAPAATTCNIRPMPQQRLRQPAPPRSGASSGLVRYAAPLLGLGLTIAFVVVFFAGRADEQPLNDVAPRVGMSYEELMAMGPRIAASTGATLGTSRHVVYLLACSGQADKTSFEARATEAGRLAREQRLSDREAVQAVVRSTPIPAGGDFLKSC